MPKPVLIIQLRPEDKASDSEFNAILSKSGLKKSDVERIRAEAVSIRGLNINKYSAIIVGGSPFDVTTPEDKKSATQKRVEAEFMELLDKVVSNDFPFIGACSGNGLLSTFLGGEMSRKYPEPVSAVDAYLTEAGKQDKLLKGFPSKFRVLVGHKEACEIPPKEAVVLAYSKTCPTQMLRVKNNVYSTQFHPEADFEEFKLRINIYKNYGYFPPEQANELIEALKGEQIIWPQKILQNFVRIYYKRHRNTLFR